MCGLMQYPGNKISSGGGDLFRSPLGPMTFGAVKMRGHSESLRSETRKNINNERKRLNVSFCLEIKAI